MQVGNVSNNVVLQIQGGQSNTTFSPGQVVEAEVVSVEGNDVYLRTGDDTVLLAKNTSSTPIKPGDMITLSVTQSSDKSVSMQIVSLNQQPLIPDATNLQHTLIRLNIDPTRSNTSLAQILLTQGFEPTSELMKNLSIVLTKFPKIPNDVAVTIANYPSLITNEQLPQVLKDGFQSHGQQLNQLVTQLEQDIQDQNFLQPKEEIQSNDSALVKNPTPLKSEQQQAVQVKQDNVFNLPEKVVSSNKNASVQVQQPDLPLTKENVAPKMQVANNSAVDSAMKVKPETPQSFEQLIESAQAKIQNNDAQKQQNPQNLIPDKQTVDLPVKEIAMLSKILKSVFEPLDANTAPRIVKDSASSVGEKLTTVLSNLNDVSTTSKATLAQLSSQTQITKEMNNFFYAQVPFSFQEEKQTADLYVLKRNPKTGEIDPKNAKIALCLQTEHMGLVESVIKIELKNINLQMRVENEEIIQYLKGKTRELNEVVSDLGYRLNALQVQLIQNPITPLNFERCFEVVPRMGRLNIEL